MLGWGLRSAVGVVVVAVVLILTGEVPAVAKVQVIAPAATVTRIIDGDTLVADSRWQRGQRSTDRHRHAGDPPARGAG
jgi:hypothetical protein